MGRDPLVLVTGAGGQVGRALTTLLPNGRFATHHDLDVTDIEAVRTALSGVDFVAHCAAMTDVRGCEVAPVEAGRINSEGTLNVVTAAKEVGAHVIYLSTDYVFDGSKGGCYEEGDEPHPLNVYGASKLRGEHHVVGSGGTVIRTSWVYGEGRNFIATIVRAAASHQELSVVDDQIGRPTSADDLAHAVHHIVQRPTNGVVHVSGDGPPASWADVAERSLGAASSVAKVRRIRSADYESNEPPPVPARPANSVLCLDLAVELGFRLRDWRRSVDAYAKGIA